MKRFLKAVLLAFAVWFAFSGVVFAAWQFMFPTNVVDTSGATRAYYPALLGYSGQTLVDAEKIAASGLDTNMQVGGGDVPYMIGTTQVAAVVPTLPADGLAKVDLYTGYTPNQTEFDITVGDGGYVTTSDAVALEAGNHFDIETEVYIPTGIGNDWDFVDKRSSIGISVTDDGQVSGIVYFDDPIDITPIVFGAWTDEDISFRVPSYATGAVVHLWTNAGPKEMNVRMNGSVDNRHGDVVDHAWTIVGLDAGEIFDVYLQDNTCFCYLVGFTGLGYEYNLNADDISLGGVGAWTNIDLSVLAPDAVGAIVEVYETGVGNQNFGLRKNGSADARTNIVINGGQSWGIIGCDGGQLIQGFIGNVSVDFYLIGYITDTHATFKTNGVDVSLGGAGAWTDIDCTAATSSDATHVIIEVVGGGVGGDYGLRRNGSAENIYFSIQDHYWVVVECDEGEIVEGKISNLAVDFFIVGYVTGGVKSPYDWWLLVNGVDGDISTMHFWNNGVNQTGLTVGAVSNTVAASLGAAPDTDTDWRLLRNLHTYFTKDTGFVYDVGGVEVVRYNPSTMIVGTTLPDLTGVAQNGTITWGSNTNVTLEYGEMVSYESTSAVVGGAVEEFTMPTSPMPSTWFASGENVSALPFYDSFSSVSLQTGQPVQMLYALAVVGVAFGVFILIVASSRSALTAYVAMVIVFVIGSSMTIIPWWIVFALCVVGAGIMYLYKQVSY